MDGDETITPLKRRRKKKCAHETKPSDKRKVPTPDASTRNTGTLGSEDKAKTHNARKVEKKEKPIVEHSGSVTLDNQCSSRENRSDQSSSELLFCSRNNKADSKNFKSRCEMGSSLSKDQLVSCPVCCFDLRFLHGVSAQTHVNGCLDMDPGFEMGYCSADSSCSLSDVNHFRKYKHEKVALLSSDETESSDSLDYSKDVPADKCEIVEIIETHETAGKERGTIPGKMTQTTINDFFGGKKPQNKHLNQKPYTSSKANAFIAKGPKTCPFYKKIPGTTITVDAFRYGGIEGCTAYFLSHFHYDHYGGLKESFDKQIYCSQVTANLVLSQIKVSADRITVLPMNTTIEVEHVKVTLIDANHCPGSVMFLMELPSKKRVLHVGDFRADVSMLHNTFISSGPIHTLYLDTTYCQPKYTFPPQDDVISFVVRTTQEYLQRNNKTLIVCGAYSVGKEKVFKSIAIDQDLKIGVAKAKHKLLSCLGDDELVERLTFDYTQAQLHVLPLGKLNIKFLSDHLKKHKSYDQLVAFKPTGWTFSDQLSSVHDIQPTTHESVTIFGVPYSEHSNFEELKMFVQKLRPQNIIPTVNIGSKESRDQMNSYFNEWLADKGDS